MTEKKTADPSTAELLQDFEQLFSQSLPDEYKLLAKNSQQQADFFKSFIQSVADKENLSSFWSLSETLGFDQIQSNKNNSLNSFNWLSKLFDVSNSDNDRSPIENLAYSFVDMSTQYQTEFIAFQKALAEINTLYQQINSSAFDRFKQRQQASDITNPEQLCHFWLEAGEESFKELSSQQSYIAAQQQLFNSLTSLTDQYKEFLQQISSLLGLPTQKDIDELREGIHELRLSFAEYRDKTEAEIITLKKQLNS